MYFQLNELLRWLGLTAFEIFTALLCFLAFSVLVTIKVRQLYRVTIHNSKDLLLTQIWDVPPSCLGSKQLQ